MSPSHASQEKLNHACFISPNGGRKKLFRICRFRRGKRSKLTSHLNFRDIREDECSLNLYGGDGTYEVIFAQLSKLCVELQPLIEKLVDA